MVDLVEGAVHAFDTDKVRASVSKAGILALTNFAIAWMVQIRPLAVVDGQVSGIGGVSVEGNESVHQASNAWIKRDVNTPICDPSLRGSWLDSQTELNMMSVFKFSNDIREAIVSAIELA